MSFEPLGEVVAADVCGYRSPVAVVDATGTAGDADAVGQSQRASSAGSRAIGVVAGLAGLVAFCVPADPHPLAQFGCDVFAWVVVLGGGNWLDAGPVVVGSTNTLCNGVRVSSEGIVGPAGFAANRVPAFAVFAVVFVAIGGFTNRGGASSDRMLDQAVDAGCRFTGVIGGEDALSDGGGPTVDAEVVDGVEYDGGGAGHDDGGGCPAVPVRF